MTTINRFNPAKSLFLRVFLWFWLAALLLIVSSIWLANQLSSEAKYQPIDPKQRSELATLTAKLQSQFDRRSSEVALDRVVNQISRRNRLGLIVFDPSTKTIVHNASRHRRIEDKFFQDFNQQSTPLMLQVKGLTLVGPGMLSVQQRDYLIFLVGPRPGGQLRVIRHEYPGLFIALIVCLSAGLCYLFVRGLLSPITQLRSASKRMAAGEMGVRVDTASKRLDEIGQLSRDFNFMSEQIEGLIKSQKRLLADISHELRSPLTRLQLSIGIAWQQDQDELSDNLRAALERIEKEALRIEQMIAQVLQLSRLDTQQANEKMQTVNLEDLMTPIIKDGQFEARHKGKALRYQGPDNVSFCAQPLLLSSAIENILRNGIYYSTHLVQVRVTVRQNHVVWAIEDDGCGIEDNQLDKIFDAFYRESAARDRSSGGVGLGLAIAYRAVSKHKGKIQAENSASGGLLVTLSIPIAGA